MNTNSNSYTIIYASVLVIIVAFLLAFVNSSLRELQGKNVGYEETDSFFTGHSRCAESRSQVCRGGEGRYAGG